jgi:hypothetical protein
MESPRPLKGLLFELINGGAEEYVKEGSAERSWRLTETMRESGSTWIYMKCFSGEAKRIYRKKAGDKGKGVSVGEEAPWKTTT